MFYLPQRLSKILGPSVSPFRFVIRLFLLSNQCRAKPLILPQPLGRSFGDIRGSTNLCSALSQITKGCWVQRPQLYIAWLKRR